MKKYILLLFIFCLQLAPTKAQWVTIPDANFATKLQLLFPSCMSGNQMDTTCAGIVNATSLMVGYLNITNLSGVQYFDNLTNLSCYNNQITSLPPLPHNLIDLWCYDNQLNSLPNLPISQLNAINL
jgi:Leucine-rich repeat (LRR) protein